MLIGTKPIPASDWAASDRPGQNISIYKQVVDEQRNTKWAYFFAASGINICLLLQIAVATSLTVLGASGGPHSAITSLGAINTTIAGILTYLKGQGLPNRLHQYRYALAKLRQYIDSRERDFKQPDCKLDVLMEVEVIRQMYAAVRQTAEDNYPDAYINRTTAPSTTIPTQLHSTAAAAAPPQTAIDRPSGSGPPDNGGDGPSNTPGRGA